MSSPFPHSPVIRMNVRERKPRQKKINGEITVFYAVLRFKNYLILISKKIHNLSDCTKHEVFC